MPAATRHRSAVRGRGSSRRSGARDVDAAVGGHDPGHAVPSGALGAALLRRQSLRG